MIFHGEKGNGWGRIKAMDGAKIKAMDGAE
jgi:hypothetical protein